MYYRRQSLRLPNVDYSADNRYFITLSTEQDLPFFDNQFQQLAETIWHEQVARYAMVYCHKIAIKNSRLLAILEWRNDLLNPHENAISLPKFIAQYKSKSTVYIRKAGLTAFRWRRDFYEHIIRNQIEFDGLIHRLNHA